MYCTIETYPLAGVRGRIETLREVRLKTDVISICRIGILLYTEMRTLQLYIQLRVRFLNIRLSIYGERVWCRKNRKALPERRWVWWES